MIESIRTYFFEKEKNKHLRQNAPAKVRFQRNRPNHYGILLDATNPDDRNTAIVFAEKLRKEGNRAKILGFVNGKMESIALSFDVFTTADLAKISQVPKSPLAISFMEQSFDVLINLSIKQNHKPLDYICAVSKAAFKVGPFYKNLEQNLYDLCIHVDEKSSLKSWINEVMHTLQKIY
jgi:hypothetical protein